MVSSENLDCDDGGGGPLLCIETDEVVSSFAHILLRSCFRRVEDLINTPEDCTVAIVCNFPKKDCEIVWLYATDWDKAQLLLNTASAVSNTCVKL
jgi:hypothetical protein